MSDPRTLGHGHTVAGGREAAADAEDQVRVVQEMVQRFGDRAPAGAQRQGMRLRKRALPLQARGHWRFQQFRQLAQLRPRPRVVHPLPRIEHRPLGCYQGCRDLGHGARVRPRPQARRGRISPAVRHFLVEEVVGQLDQHRSRTAIAHLREGAPHGVGHRLGQDHLLSPLGDVLIVEERAEVGRDVESRRG